MAGNQTLTIVAEMLNEVVARAVTMVSQSESRRPNRRRPVARGSIAQHRLVDLIEAGDEAGAESHWRTHMGWSAR